MTDETCIYRGLDQPRTIKGRHLEDCEGGCPGCQPCLRAHCRGCDTIHSASVCPGCMADIRVDIDEIVRESAALPAEVEHRGVDSAAAVLAGPVADPEAYQHRTMSALMGRIDERWLETADDVAHPLWVLGTAELAMRAILDLPEPEGRVTVESSAAWILAHLSVIAACEDHDWGELRREVAGCRRYMEAVLHDGEQVDQGAPCMKCETNLRRCWAGRELPWSTVADKQVAREDGWACPRCKRWHNEQQYRLAVTIAYREESDDLPLLDIAERLSIDIRHLRKLCAPVRVSRDGEIVELPPRLTPSGTLAGRKVYRVARVQELIEAC